MYKKYLYTYISNMCLKYMKAERKLLFVDIRVTRKYKQNTFFLKHYG